MTMFLFTFTPPGGNTCNYYGIFVIETDQEITKNHNKHKAKESHKRKITRYETCVLVCVHVCEQLTV